MQIADAQREMRQIYLGGWPGQLVSGMIWLFSATVAVWRSPQAGITVLVVGGVFIFWLTQLLLRALGRQASLPPHNPLDQLAFQIAMTLPLNLPLIAAATLYRLEWFYPAFMIALGAHYLPFVFLYGMWQFGVLAALLVGGGLGLALWGPLIFSLGGWLTAGLLLLFALAVGVSAPYKADARAVRRTAV